MDTDLMAFDLGRVTKPYFMLTLLTGSLFSISANGQLIQPDVGRAAPLYGVVPLDDVKNGGPAPNQASSSGDRRSQFRDGAVPESISKSVFLYDGSVSVRAPTGAAEFVDVEVPKHHGSNIGSDK